MSKFFCPLPWVHQFIHPQGIKMCCSSKTTLDLTVNEFKNSQYLTEIKELISNGQVPHDCTSCVETEKNGYASTRTLALNDWSYTIETVPDQILYFDVRWSNLCNFSCRTCEPAFSSEIARERQIFPVHLFNNKVKEDLLEHLSQVQKINFTGGEPLLIKENIEILEKLLSLGRTDCEILITTNASVINGKLLEIIKQFKTVHWTISIDAVSRAAEYIRNGTVWSIVEENIYTILKLKHSVALNCVLSAYSVLDIDKLVNFFVNLKSTHKTQPLELWFAVCTEPVEINPMLLPNKYKSIAIEKLHCAINLLTDIKDNPVRSLQTLKSLHNNLSTEHVDNDSLFLEYTQNLDGLRSQNFNNIFNLGE